MYIAMELGGARLSDVINERRGMRQPFSALEVQTISRSCVEAVATFHAHGWLLANFTPNVMMMVEDSWKISNVRSAMSA